MLTCVMGWQAAENISGLILHISVNLISKRIEVHDGCRVDCKDEPSEVNV